MNSLWQFWVLAVLCATSQGGIQALSRSMYGKLIPDKDRSGEFFGFFSSFFGGDSGLSFFFFAFLSGFFFEVDDARFDIFFALQLRLHFGLSQFSFFDFVLLGEDSLLGFEFSHFFFVFFFSLSFFFFASFSFFFAFAFGIGRSDGIVQEIAQKALCTFRFMPR